MWWMDVLCTYQLHDAPYDPREWYVPRKCDAGVRQSTALVRQGC